MGKEDGRIHAFGAVRGDTGQGCHGDGSAAELTRLDALADGVSFLLGHNLIAFDLPYLKAAKPDLRLLTLPAVDTLRLSPLAFPRNPYHRLVKHYQDGGLVRGRINDPELDARLALAVFGEQREALSKAEPALLAAWHWLTTPEPDGVDRALDDFFSALRGAPRPVETEAHAALGRRLEGAACATHAREAVAEAATAGWALAYALAWLSVAGGDSVMPPWVRHQFPEAGKLVRRLRDTACTDPACGWCREQHDARREMKRWFGFDDFRPEPPHDDGRSMQQAIVETALAYNRHAAVDIRRRLHALIGDDARGVTVLTCHGLAMRLAGASFTGRTETPDERMFEEIMRSATALLRGEGLPPEVADEQRERLLAGFRWILVDEYQDIDGAQYDLISALAGRTLEDEDGRLTLFAVGDDDQNIYAFNGASVEFIRRFEADYGPKSSHLVGNYRSTGHIVAAANAMIEPARERMKTEHPIHIDKARAKDPPGGVWEERDPVARGRVQILPAGRDPVAQAQTVMAEFLRLKTLSPDLQWSRCAVIARAWKYLAPVRAFCEAHGIPAQMGNEEIPNFWRLRETRAFVAWLRARKPRVVDGAALRGWAEACPPGPWHDLLRQAIDEHALSLVPARGHDAPGAGGRLRSSDVHAPPARRQPPLQWPVPGARELRRGVLRSADRPSPLDGAARQHYLPSWRITPCLETGRLRHPPRYATSFSQPVTHSRRGGKKSIPHESRLGYNCACLLYATDGPGNCLIAGPISGTNVGACWSNPGPGFFGTICLSNFRLTIFAVTLMNAWADHRRIYTLSSGSCFCSSCTI